MHYPPIRRMTALMLPSPRHRRISRPLFHDFTSKRRRFCTRSCERPTASARRGRSTASSALHFGPRWRLLRAIERCGGAPTFADLGRLLEISRQAAREQALKTAEAGLVELFATPDDRRVLQVMLTPAGRRALERQRMPDFAWVFTLLNGLEPSAMRETNHVLRVLRLRLERYQREMRRVARLASGQRGIGSPFKNAMSPRTWR